MSNQKIIVLGDGMVDAYYIGTSSRLSPEAPIPVVTLQEEKFFPGGALNVRENLRSLGEDGMFLFPPRDRQNFPLKMRLICNGEQVARVDQGDWCNPYLREDLLPLMDADAVVVSDYDKGSISKEVIQILHDYRGPLFVDTKKDPTDWIGSNAVMFPNLKEYREFEDAYGWFSRVVLKQSEKGLAWMEFGKVIIQRPSYVDFVKSVNGAGDSVLAGFVVAWLDGADLPFCLDFANCCAAISCEHDFTYTPTLHEVAERTAQVLEGWKDSNG
jgi:D-glycero-beta-D-manno-heptose-7-phosphate kinase